MRCRTSVGTDVAVATDCTPQGAQPLLELLAKLDADSGCAVVAGRQLYCACQDRVGLEPERRARHRPQAASADPPDDRLTHSAICPAEHPARASRLQTLGRSA